MDAPHRACRFLAGIRSGVINPSGLDTHKDSKMAALLDRGDDRQTDMGLVCFPSSELVTIRRVPSSLSRCDENPGLYRAARIVWLCKHIFGLYGKATLHISLALHHTPTRYAAKVTRYLSFTFNALEFLVTRVTQVTLHSTVIYPRSPIRYIPTAKEFVRGGTLRNSVAYGAGNPRISIS